MSRSPGKPRHSPYLFAILILICMVLSMASANIERQGRPSPGLWVTFETQGERFRALVTAPEATEYVRAFVAGSAPRKSPRGLVEAGGSFNSPWSWHLLPESVVFADPETVDCEGSPSGLELEDARLPAYRCFRGARIVRVEDCQSGKCVSLKGLYAGRSPF